MFGYVLERVAATVRGWQDPVQRHQRALNRARDVVRRRITVTAGLTGATAILLPYHGVGLLDVGWAAATGASFASAVLAHRRLAEVRAYVPPPAVPRRMSSARPAIDRLGRAVETLRALLARLGSAADGTAREAASAERSLRELAARVDAVEGALTVTPVEAHAGLYEAGATLLARLDEGTQAYELLVAAAAQCVAADAGGPRDAFARRRLEEATERLHGLAAGLLEVREVGRAYGIGPV